VTAWRYAAVTAAALVLRLMPACDPPPPPRFGLDACNQYLPGSPELTDIDASGVPIVCEHRDPSLKPVVLGWWDGTTIHIYDPPPDLADKYSGSYVLHYAGHEYAHALGDRHQNWVESWASVRHSGKPAEDFAESFVYCIYPSDGTNFIFYSDHMPSADECAAMEFWYSWR